MPYYYPDDSLPPDQFPVASVVVTPSVVADGGSVTVTGTCSGGDAPVASLIQVSTNGGTSWSNIGPSPISFNATQSQNGYQYRAICTDADGDADASSAVTLTVTTTSNIELRNPWSVDNYTLNEKTTLADMEARATWDPTYGMLYDPEISGPLTQNVPTHNTQGQFRFRAAPSHYLPDDPILRPGQPGGSHLHLFWGNTWVDANTTFNTLENCGSSTNQGNIGNRTAYWMPALFDGPKGGAANPRNIVVPARIRLYYKSRFSPEVQPVPKGLQLLGGNVYVNGPNGMIHPWEMTNPVGPGNGSRKIEAASWGFFAPNTPAANLPPKIDFIPPTNPDGWPQIRCSVGFPFCLQTDDGTANGNPILTSTDWKSHARDNLKSGGGQGDDLATPASHPYRIPHIQYLVDFNCPTDASEYQEFASRLRLASDLGADTVAQLPDINRGQSLHGDIIFNWSEGVQQAWLDSSYQPPLLNASNGNIGAPINRTLNPVTGGMITGNAQAVEPQSNGGPHYSALLFPDPWDSL